MAMPASAGEGSWPPLPLGASPSAAKTSASVTRPKLPVPATADKLTPFFFASARALPQQRHRTSRTNKRGVGGWGGVGWVQNGIQGGWEGRAALPRWPRRRHRPPDAAHRPITHAHTHMAISSSPANRQGRIVQTQQQIGTTTMSYSKYSCKHRPPKIPHGYTHEKKKKKRKNTSQNHPPPPPFGRAPFQTLQKKKKANCIIGAYTAPPAYCTSLTWELRPQPPARASMQASPAPPGHPQPLPWVPPPRL